MFESAYALEADMLNAVPRARNPRATVAYGHHHFDSAEEHTEVVEREEEAPTVPGRYRDYLTVAIISANLAAFGAVLFVAIGHQ